MKVQTFADAEKHAVLIIDEMSIKPGLQYDNSIVAVVGRPTMKLSGGFDSSHQKATHALVFMLYGISTKWKQTIGYEFTGSKMYDIIHKCELLYRKNEANLLSNKLQPINFVNLFLETCSIDFVPQCHNIVFKLLKTFVISISTYLFLAQKGQFDRSAPNCI
ncbi:uncharacterized protein LOC112588104 isoform X1 [Harpegnathos saltator]|uniref:uncharacterized protein LOC112588104 isoform X1 n=1 Tax=Harpegnathos saltator TaxID=610380 RepID=UPI000DBEEF75|nr:uncharacterized protein LOC112588104 isoform X1 [Harpegnathos saltator]